MKVWQLSLAVVIAFVLSAGALLLLSGCEQRNVNVQPGPVAASGVHEIKPEVKTGSDGLTNEQRNIKDRYAMDSLPGSIKHLYIISAYSGDVIIYSTVRGKVTSSGKRLTPTSVTAGHVGISGGQYSGSDSAYGIPVNIAGQHQRTGEVLQDDGTFGHSIDYLYWFDSKGIYHQHYVQGGQIVHVASEPLAVKKIIINMESKAVDEK